MLADFNHPQKAPGTKRLHADGTVQACAEQRSATNCQRTNRVSVGIESCLMLQSDYVRHNNCLVMLSADHSACPHHHCLNRTSVHSNGAQAGP